MLCFTLQWVIVGSDTRIERDSKLAMQSFYTRRPTVQQLTHTTHTHTDAIMDVAGECCDCNEIVYQY